MAISASNEQNFRFQVTLLGQVLEPAPVELDVQAGKVVDIFLSPSPYLKRGTVEIGIGGQAIWGKYTAANRLAYAPDRNPANTALSISLASTDRRLTLRYTDENSPEVAFPAGGYALTLTVKYAK